MTHASAPAPPLVAGRFEMLQTLGSGRLGIMRAHPYPRRETPPWSRWVMRLANKPLSRASDACEREIFGGSGVPDGRLNDWLDRMNALAGLPDGELFAAVCTARPGDCMFGAARSAESC